MKLVTIFKSTICGKSKLFEDYKDAMLHSLAFMRNTADGKKNTGITIAPIKVFYDGNTYFNATVESGDHPKEDLEPNHFHALFTRLDWHRAYNQFGSDSYSRFFLTQLPSNFKELTHEMYDHSTSFSGPESVYKDADGKLLTVGAVIQVEKSAPELSSLRSIMDESADAIYSHEMAPLLPKLSLLSQRATELKQKQDELKQKQQELEDAKKQLNQEEKKLEADQRDSSPTKYMGFRS